MVGLALGMTTQQLVDVGALLTVVVVSIGLSVKEATRFGLGLGALQAVGLIVALGSFWVVPWWAAIPLALVAVVVVLVGKHVVVMRRLLRAEVMTAPPGPMPMVESVGALAAQGFVLAAAVELRPPKAPPMTALLLVDPAWATYAHVSDPDGRLPIVSLHSLLPGGRIVTATRSMPTSDRALLQALDGGAVHDLVGLHRRTLQWAHEHRAPLAAATADNAVDAYRQDLADDQAWLAHLGVLGLARTLLPVDRATPIAERPDAVDQLVRLSQPR